MMRLVVILVLRHLQDRPEIFVEPLGKLHHGVVQALDPRLQTGRRFDGRQQLGMTLDVVLSARQLTSGGGCDGSSSLRIAARSSSIRNARPSSSVPLSTRLP